MDPVENLEHRMCLQHDKPLELFCCTDHSCICTICPLLEHNDHECVPLKEEYDRRRSSLQQTQAQIQHMVEQRTLKIHEIQDSVKLSQNAAAREKTKGLKGFAAMIQSVQRMQDQFTEELQEKQKQTLKRAQNLITELEEEICELEKRSSEMEQLSRSEDQLQFIQSSTSLKPAAALKDWSTVSFETETFEDSAVTALSDTVQELTEEINVFKAQLKDLKKFAVDITLDADTSLPQLVLSEDLKQVHHYSSNNTTINPQRFTNYHCVLGKQSFASGRAYFEVQVKSNTWWILGVAQESIEKKRYFSWDPESGVWVLSMYRVNEYYAYNEPCVPLSLKHALQKVGVFVDYGAGVVSFYDVDSKDLIYSFPDCCFRGKILPILYVNTNSPPLMLTAVKD